MDLYNTRSWAILAAVATVVAAASGMLSAPDPASARPAKCFGKRINRVITGSSKTVRLKYRDVAWIAGDRVTVIARPYTVVCADRGRQTVRAGKGRSRISTGADADRIILHPSSNLNEVHAGLGNDYIRGAAGHDFLYASPKANPPGKADRDTVLGLGGNDRIFDFSGVGNRLYGTTGSDRIFSLGGAVSSVFGGNGTDFIYSNGGIDESGRTERLFGERGNDRLYGDRAPVNGPAFFDGGSGDDWVYGTDREDTVIFHSGITKIEARGGDDLIVSTSRGAATIDGGTGTDTISYAAHTPPGYRHRSGVMVDLAAGVGIGAVRQSLAGIENVSGSPFDDDLSGRPGIENLIEGGQGDDRLSGSPNDPDRADGGLGQNVCGGFAEELNCNRKSPGRPDPGRPIVDIDRGGVLSVTGSRQADEIMVGYDPAGARYRIDLSLPAVTSGLCDGLSGGGRTVYCPASINNLNGVLVYGGDGDDRIGIAGSVPSTVSATINGGAGRNVITGGQTKDYILTEAGRSSGSVLKGGANVDMIYAMDDVTAVGGTGSDVIHAPDVCRGGRVTGGPGSDNVVFAGAARGVDADITRGTARWVDGGCARPLRIGRDVESLEGSRHNDRLTLGRRFRQHQGRRSLLGREGRDVLNSRNGTADTVTTGAGGRRNRVIADRIDRVIWGWGLAAY